jgi:hypothetical protein
LVSFLVLFPADLLFVESARMIVKPFYEILLAFLHTFFHKSEEY